MYTKLRVNHKRNIHTNGDTSLSERPNDCRVFVERRVERALGRRDDDLTQCLTNFALLDTQLTSLSAFSNIAFLPSSLLFCLTISSHIHYFSLVLLVYGQVCPSFITHFQIQAWLDSSSSSLIDNPSSFITPCHSLNNSRASDRHEVTLCTGLDYGIRSYKLYATHFKLIQYPLIPHPLSSYPALCPVP
jgi:hypothetical protein